MQSLKNGRVFAVGRGHGDSILLEQRQYHRPARDEGFFVGQRNALLRLWVAARAGSVIDTTIKMKCIVK